VATVLVGCVTAQHYNNTVSTWVGESKEHLIETWGAPDQTYQISKDKEALTYFEDKGANHYRVGYTVVSKNKTCKTTFITENDIVKSYSFEGRGCRQ
jgi:hypothetical protein